MSGNRLASINAVVLVKHSEKYAGYEDKPWSFEYWVAEHAYGTMTTRLSAGSLGEAEQMCRARGWQPIPAWPEPPPGACCAIAPDDLPIGYVTVPYLAADIGEEATP